jgi:hypothetical protein
VDKNITIITARIRGLLIAIRLEKLEFILTLIQANARVISRTNTDFII